MASATSASAPAANTAKDAFYHSVKNTIYHCSLDCLAPFEPFIATYNGKQIPFVGKVNHIATNTIYKLAKKEWGCRICAHRMKTMAKMVGAKGPWLSGHLEQQRTSEFQTLSNTVLGCEAVPIPADWNICTTLADWDICVFGSDYKTLYEKTRGSFDHYYLAPTVPWSSSLKPAILTSEDEVMINFTLHRYLPLVDAMLTKFSTDDWEALHSSIGYFENVMKRASYANNLAGCLKWFKAIDAMVLEMRPRTGWNLRTRTYSNLMITEKMRVVGTAILSCRIKKDNGRWMITEYHQFNDNLLGILQKSNSISAMEKILTDRFSPTKYQQRTAAPKPANIRKAMDKIGNFKFTIATTEQIEKYPECIKISNTPPGTSAMSVMEAMLVTPPKSKYGFAERINPSTPPKATTFYPTTLDELNELVREGKIYKLMVETAGHTDCYIAEVEGIERDHRIAPYAWSFLNGQTPRFTGRPWTQVSHIMPVKYSGHDNYIFCLKDASDLCTTLITGNVSWTEYLSTEIRRTCGPTFTAAAKKINISYPSNPDHHLAIGIGTSNKDSYNNLMRPIKVRINNQTDLTIRKAR